MVKLSDLKSINADMSFPVVALELLSGQANKLASLYRNLRNNYTIELLHDTRVNLRRMQALTAAFIMPLTDSIEVRNENSRHLSGIRDMIRVLSRPRTYDVSFEIVNIYSDIFSGNLTLNILGGELRVRKVKALERMYKSDVFLGFGKQLKSFEKFLNGRLRKYISSSSKDIPFRRIYRDLLTADFMKSIVKTNVIFFPSDMTAFIHSYRIALKPLRYLFDIGEGCFGGEFDKLKDKMKNLLEMLGDFNDYNMAFNLSEKIIKDDSLRNSDYMKYLFLLRKKMLSVYDEVCLYLKSLKQENITSIFT